MNNSQIEPYVLPIWAREKGITHCFIYHGPSMTPTFRNGDFLFLCPVIRKLRKGDVIVFMDSNKSGFVVHRIVSIAGEGLVTRGDHNRLRDSLPVTLDRIIGKVELVENKRGVRPVVNGLWGLWFALIWQVVFGLDRLFRRIFWMPYNFVRERKIAALFWHPAISRMHVRSENGRQIKYLYKNRTVATWDAALGRFDCRKPFDLVIPSPLDEKPPS